MLAGRPEARDLAEQAHAAAVRLAAPDVEADTLATLAVVHSLGEVPASVVDARLLQALQRARESTDVLTELRASVNISWSRYTRGDVAGALEVLEASCDRAAASGLRWSPLAVELRVLRRVVRYVAGRWGDNPDGDADLAPDVAAARLAAAGLHVQVGRGDPGAEAAVQRLVAARGLDLQVQLGVDGCLADLRLTQGRPDEAADIARAAADDLWRCFGTDQMGVIRLGAVEVAALADVAEEAALRHDDAVVAALHERAAARVARLEALYGPDTRPPARRSRAPRRSPGWPAAAPSCPGSPASPTAATRTTPGGGRWPRSATATRSRRPGAGSAWPGRCCAARAGATRAGGRPRSCWPRRRRRPTSSAPARWRPRWPPWPAGPAWCCPATTATRPTRRSRRWRSPLASRTCSGWSPGAGRTGGSGAELFISEKTVSVHLSNVMAKLGASGRTDAVSRAHRAGLLPLQA
jgi:hypothetical protein